MKLIPAMHLDRVTGSKNVVVSALLGIGLVVMWLLFWEWGVRFGLDRKLVVPPSEIIVSLYHSLLVSGEIRSDIWATVTRLLGGLIIGAAPALWLGFIMGRNKQASRRYGPLLTVLGLFPMLFALPCFIIWFGVGDLGKWAIVSAAVFYPILSCTIKGVRISKRFANERNSSVAWVDANDWDYTSGPWVFTGLKLGSIVGVATLFGAELFASTSGLGFAVVVAFAKTEMARVYTAMFTAAFLVYGIWLCLTVVEFALAMRYTHAIDRRSGDLEPPLTS